MKRVHELIALLKSQYGIALDNKAMVEAMKTLGYDVKSHSSRLEDADADEAVRKLVGQFKPAQVTPASHVRPTRRSRPTTASLGKHHYISAARELVIAHYGTGTDAYQQLIDDITYGGQLLRFVKLPPNSEGPRVGLIGKTLRVLAGADRLRKDTIFVFSDAHEGLAHRWPAPTDYHATFEVRRSVQTTRDPIDFLDESFSGAPVDEDRHPPSRDLAAVIAAASPALLPIVRPGAETTQPEVDTWRTALRSLWIQFRLQECVTISFPPRDIAILGGAIQSKLDPEVLLGLTRRLGVAVLNKASARRQFSHRHDQLLLELARLPIAPSLRAVLWTFALRPMGPDALRKEMNLVATPLAALSEDREAAEAWGTATVKALQFLAATDTGLRDIADRVQRSQSPLLDVAAWARDLRLSPSEPLSDPSANAARPSSDLPLDAPLQPTRESKNNTMAAATVEPVAVTAASTEPIAGEETVPQEDSATFNTWFISFTADVSRTKRVAEEARQAAEELSKATSTTDTPNGLLQLCRNLEALADSAKRWSGDLPAPTQLAQDLPEARKVFSRAMAVLGETTLGHLLRGNMTLWPADLGEVVDLAPRLDALFALPAWVFGEETRASDSASNALVHTLTQPAVRRRIRLAIDLMDEFKSELPAGAREIRPPPPDTNDLSHLEVELRAVYDTKAALQRAPAEHTPWVRAALERGEDPTAIQRTIDRIEAFREVLDDAAFRGAIPYISDAATADDRETRIRAVRSSIDTLTRVLGSLTGLRWEQFQPTLTSVAEITDSKATARFSVEHDMVGVPPRRAELYCHHRNEEDLWVYVETPLVIQTDEPGDADLQISCREVTKYRDGWPSDWPSIEPNLLKVTARDWIESPDRWTVPFSVSVPIRRPIANKKGEADLTRKFELEISLLDAKSGQEVAPPKTLTWEGLHIDDPNLRVDWAEDCNPDFVREHPVGPQSNPKDYRDRVEQGGSFAVVAPRRFGKTTLVKYLENLGNDLQDVVVLPHLACTSFLQGMTVDYEALWRRVNDNLFDALNVGMELSLENNLPSSRAFDKARKKAHLDGYRSIVILIDEAQLFFPRDSRGHALGSRLKNLLEVEWGKRDGLARIVFGLVGLPGLQDRAGVDFMGRLQPRVGSNIGEADLNRLLFKVTRIGEEHEARQTLQTTRAARLAIASFSVNLLVLRDVVRRLVKKSRTEGKTWVSHRDVLTVIREVKQEVRDNPGVDVAGSLRDVFNDAETINEFVPSPSYPVALALAQVGFGRKALSDSDAITQALGPLREWSVSINEASSLHSIAFERERVAEQLAVLRDRGIVRGLKFGYELLEAWLEGQAKNPPLSDDAFREAILNAAARRIRRPASLEKVATGGQANLYRFQRRDTDLVWREVRISTDDEKRRFLEAADAIQRILRSQRRREEGSDCVFELEEMGLVDHEPSIGAQIYRWIPGTDLSSRLNQLPADAVAVLGTRLFAGLEWLHGSAVLHRDIKPANIVIRDNDMWPVLIDFGFAKFASATMETRIAGDFSAPETLERVPRWSRAADIYSLCATLSAVMRSGGQRATSVSELLQSGLELQPEKRATPRALREQLEVLVHDFKLDERRRAFWAQVENVSSRDNNKGWFRALLIKFQPQFEAHSLGMNSDYLHRCALVADLANQALEAGTPRYDNATLGKLKHAAASEPESESITLGHSLRNWKSHGSVVLRNDIQRTPPDKLVQSIQKLAEQVGGKLKLVSFGDLAQFLLAEAR